MTRALLVLLVFVASVPAAGQGEIPRRDGDLVDTWSEPNPGVRYLHRTASDPPLSVHALVVDLSHEGVSAVATPERERWNSISGFARARGAVAAVNGGFWGMMQRPIGVTAGDGQIWSHSAPSPDFGHLALAGGRARIHEAGQGEDEGSLARLDGAISGRPVLVVGGEVQTNVLAGFATANLKQPRTAVGVSRDGRTLVVVVADGRQQHSRGLTLYQVARLLVELGADRGLNLDGGGSSAMYVERSGGLVSSPARGRWAGLLGVEDETARVRTRHGEREVYVRGVEREVMNHLAILAPARAVAVAGDDQVLLDGLGHIAEQDRRPAPARLRRPILLGTARELVYPALYVAVPLGLLLALVLMARRLGATLGRSAAAE